MSVKRSIIYGVIFWIALFIVISVLMFTAGLSTEGMTFNIIVSILGIIVVAIVSHYQFRKEQNPQGFLTGLIYALVGLILDALITVPLFIKDYALLFNLPYFVSVVLGIITVMVVASTKKKR